MAELPERERSPRGGASASSSTRRTRSSRIRSLDFARRCGPSPRQGGKQLWFGRYTGATLGSGLPAERGKGQAARREGRRELRSMITEYDAFAEHGRRPEPSSLTPVKARCSRAGTWWPTRRTSW